MVDQTFGIAPGAGGDDEAYNAQQARDVAAQRTSSAVKSAARAPIAPAPAPTAPYPRILPHKPRNILRNETGILTTGD
jgi:hypothetical protein